MKTNIYVQLLNEGTKVYRPVVSTQIEKNTYEVGGYDIYDPEDEVWEFLPGTHVIVEEQALEGELVLVAMKKQEN